MELLEERKKKWASSREVESITEQVQKESAHDVLLTTSHCSASGERELSSTPNSAAKRSTPEKGSLAKTTVGTSSNSLSGGAGGSSAQNPTSNKNTKNETDIFLHRLTDKLTEHIRDEVMKEMQISMRNVDVRETVAEKMDSYLEAELSTHTCKICFELMTSPLHTPTLLFPCGHTFCKQCMDTHLASTTNVGSGNGNVGGTAGTANPNGNGSGVGFNRGKKCCPYCRTVIESRAINQSLKDLIDQFSKQKSMVLCNTHTIVVLCFLILSILFSK